jgi:DNA-binding MarR family transcriptional regulator
VAKGKYKSDMTLDEKVVIGIVRAADLYKKKISSIFRNYGLTFSQYVVLRILSASEKGQNTLTNISKIMLVTGANVTRIAQRLEKNGFLIRKGDPDDERAKLLEITRKGRQALRNLENEKREYLKEALVDYPDELKKQIVSKIRQILQKEAPESFNAHKKKLS